MQSAVDRRIAVLEMLCGQRHVNIANLMFEFNVSRSTVIRDLQVLSISHPIFTIPGNGGGIYIAEGYHLGRKYLKSYQEALLKKLLINLNEEDYKIMVEILHIFSYPVNDRRVFKYEFT